MAAFVTIVGVYLPSAFLVVCKDALVGQRAQVVMVNAWHFSYRAEVARVEESLVAFESTDCDCECHIKGL